MTKGRQADNLPIIIPIRLIGNLIKNLGRQMHSSQRVLKSRMGPTWIDHIGNPQLMDITEPLKDLSVDQSALKLVKMDKTMYRIVNLHMKKLSLKPLKRKGKP